MKKYYYENQEVFLGDEIKVKKNKITPCGNQVIELFQYNLNSQEVMDKLVEKGILEIKEELEDARTKLDFYIDILADNLYMSFEDTKDMLERLVENGYPMAALNMVYCTIADYLEKYFVDEDPKESLEKVYIINSMDGSIMKVRTNEATNYDCFAAFRSREDAELAIEITKEWYNEVF